jgi:hypothetical protein
VRDSAGLAAALAKLLTARLTVQCFPRSLHVRSCGGVGRALVEQILRGRTQACDTRTTDRCTPAPPRPLTPQHRHSIPLLRKQACAALAVSAVVDSQLVLTASDAGGEARARRCCLYACAGAHVLRLTSAH